MIIEKEKKIRVRMAPSPTGNLHIGTARTALFNFLFARKLGGALILRIEDTDEARSTKESEKDILDGFSWLGIAFDEGVMPDGSQRGEFGPYRQTECLPLYKKYLEQLLAEHKSYYCFCSKEELEVQRQSQEATGQAPKYSGKCRSVTLADAAQRMAAGERAVIRIKVDGEKKTFHDLIRGDVTFDNALMGDLVIAKSLTQPLYNFAVVVDDQTMQISHVIRGEDHLANTPKQMVIAQALGFQSPLYAHIPLILSAMGKGKMSKRDGGTAIREYRAAGYLPGAIINFLALLGWHPTEGAELLGLKELIALFELDRVQKGGAKFDKAKLDHFNMQYLKQLSGDALVALLSDDAWSDALWRVDAARFRKLVLLVRDRMVTLGDFRVMIAPLFAPWLAGYDGKILIWKKGSAAGAKENLARCRELLSGVSHELFTKESLDPKVAELAERHGKGDVFWPLRVALSGKEQSPPPVELLVMLGKDEALKRIDQALALLV